MKAPSIALGRPLGASLLLGAVLITALAAVGASWADLSAASEERDAKAELLQRGVAASLRARVAPAAAEADPFVAAETATLAAAAVDSELRSLATVEGLSLLSSRADAKPAEPGAVGGPGTRIEDQAVLEGQNEALQALLVRLENRTPLLFVDDLALELAEVGADAGGDPQSPRLRMSVTLSAYWRPAGAASR